MRKNRKPYAGTGRHLLSVVNRAVLLLGMLACTPVLAGDDDVFASSFEDGEGASTGWQVLEWPFDVSYELTCALVRVYGVSEGDEFIFTTCVPPGYAGPIGSGDPKIDSVVDSQGVPFIAANDDCDVEFVPQMTGWNCGTSSEPDFDRMPCAPPDGEGVVVAPGATYLDVTICPYDPTDGTSPGTAPFHVLWKGPSTPNPG